MSTTLLHSALQYFWIKKPDGGWEAHCCGTLWVSWSLVYLVIFMLFSSQSILNHDWMEQKGVSVSSSLSDLLFFFYFSGTAILIQVKWSISFGFALPWWLRWNSFHTHLPFVFHLWEILFFWIISIELWF